MSVKPLRNPNSPAASQPRGRACSPTAIRFCRRLRGTCFERQRRSVGQRGSPTFLCSGTFLGVGFQTWNRWVSSVPETCSKFAGVCRSLGSHSHQRGRSACGSSPVTEPARPCREVTPTPPPTRMSHPAARLHLSSGIAHLPARQAHTWGAGGGRTHWPPHPTPPPSQNNCRNVPFKQRPF